MSNRLRKSESDSQFDVGAGRFQPVISASRTGHLPQVIERGQVDAAAGRQLALEPDAAAPCTSSTLWHSRSQIDRVPASRPRRTPARRRGAVDVADLEADVRVARAGARRSSRAGSRCPCAARWAAPPAGRPRRSRPPAPTRRPGSMRAQRLAQIVVQEVARRRVRAASRAPARSSRARRRPARPARDGAGAASPCRAGADLRIRFADTGHRRCPFSPRSPACSAA